MNKKKTITKILSRIALLLVMVSVLAVVLSGCGNQTVINTATPEAGWDKTEVNLSADTGFINKLLSWIGIFLGWITRIMPANSYILTLFIFAILMELLMLPFSVKQQKNSIKQSMLRPKEMAIRKKYAGRNDQATQQKMSMEIQELYQKENFNPMSGCMPLLFQLPIIMILYWLVIDPIMYMFNGSAEFKNVLYAYITTATENGGLGLKLSSTNGSIEMLSKINELGAGAFEGIKTFCANGEAVFAQIEDIAAQSLNFNIGPVNLGITPSFTPADNMQYWLLVIPVITFATYFLSMRLNRRLTYQPGQDSGDRQMACSNKMMDITMPLMSVWMTFIVPGAVGIYWVFKSLIGMVKQFILSKSMPLPVFTEEDYKAAERELLGKQPKKIQKSANVGKVRSLHHIDDEDYDEHGNYVPKVEETPEETVEEQTTKLPENSMTEGASLKDDSDKAETKKRKSLFGKKDKKD
ncbi:MAG: membrane protein insertase YidC [Clostridia bacterium]|nr:membrane protein insertase YidC [Clostridia bacterium]